MSKERCIDTADGNFDFSRPNDRVENCLSEVGVPPVVVKVPTRGAETAAASFAFPSPGDDAATRFSPTERGDFKQRRRQRIAPWEAKVVVELLAHLERLHATHDGMSWTGKL